jgi:hypothetical protein
VKKRVIKKEKKEVRRKNKINKIIIEKLIIISQLGLLFWPEDVGSR